LITIREPKVVAEIGCNHRGEFETATEMIMMAAQFCKVQVVKFQKRNPRECLPQEAYEQPHPNPYHSYGSTYGEHREHLEFDLETHRRLKDVCEAFGVLYSSSVWDLTSAHEIISLNPALIKVPSACNTHQKMLETLCGEYGGEIHISLGMTTQEEKDRLIDLLSRQDRLKDVVLYHCTSGYPVPFEDVNLPRISRLVNDYGGLVKAIGFSGHHLGVAIDIVAFTLGADWFERHFTLDRTWKGTDHAASLEPDGMRRVVRDLKATARALIPHEEDVLPVEWEQRKKLKYNTPQPI
jgi:N-acetylneuraminate synthase